MQTEVTAFQSLDIAALDGPRTAGPAEYVLVSASYTKLGSVSFLQLF